MRVTVQNGAKHGLSRSEAEMVVRVLPPSLSSVAKSLVLYGTTDSEIKVSYHPKEQVIGLYWPIERSPVPSKSQAVEELLVALSIIAESGNLPERISHSLWSRHLEAIGALYKKWQGAL